MYVRPVGKAQSRAVESAEEMREIADLAAEKKARQMINHRACPAEADKETLGSLRPSFLPLDSDPWAGAGRRRLPASFSRTSRVARD